VSLEQAPEAPDRAAAIGGELAPAPELPVTARRVLILRRRGPGPRPGAADQDPARLFPRIHAVVRRIPPGRVTSYGAIARALGLARGARTVGWALRSCPEDVPWHRVVNVQGRISWRPTGGHDRQRALLRQEGVRFRRDGRIDLARFGWKAL
jgi:methylated-DNA-protein-cysteine methyltransferase-like protein